MSDTEIITLFEETEPKKIIKKRTYEQQKERIKTYLKNRYANDEEYRKKVNNNRLIRNNLRYNTNEEYRLKTLEYMKAYKARKKEENNKIKMEEELKKLQDILNKMSTDKEKYSLSQITDVKRLYENIIKQYPDYNTK
jgi:hypothetical protein